MSVSNPCDSRFEALERRRPRGEAGASALELRRKSRQGRPRRVRRMADRYEEPGARWTAATSAAVRGTQYVDEDEDDGETYEAAPEVDGCEGIGGIDRDPWVADYSD